MKTVHYITRHQTQHEFRECILRCITLCISLHTVTLLQLQVITNYSNQVAVVRLPLWQYPENVLADS
jgi:hypothetical protein